MKRKNFMKRIDWKKCVKCNNDLCKTCKDWQWLSYYCKKYNKIFEDCKDYPEHIELRKNHVIFFVFKMWKRSKYCQNVTYQNL